MNRIVDEFRRDDERVLDKLVDGELAEVDRKALLSALDDEPGAWRRCALAFLEAQTWRGDFGEMLTAPVQSAPKQVANLSIAGNTASNPAENVPTVRPVASGNVAGLGLPSTASRVFEYALALAACLLLAFGLGLYARGAWQDGNGTVGPGGGQFAHSASPYAPTTTVDSLGANVRGPRQGGLVGLPRYLGNAGTAGLSPSTATSMGDPSPGISEAMRDSLEKAGHRAVHTKQLVPVELPDGSHVLMPVDQVDVEPNVRPAY